MNHDAIRAWCSFLRTRRQACLLRLLGLALVCLLAGQGTGAAPVASWALAESLGHDWRHEVVFFALPAPAPAPGQEAGYAVLDDQGQELPFQFWQKTVPDAAAPQPCVALLVDLSANSRRAFRLEVKPGSMPQTGGDVKVEEAPASYILSAGRLAVKVARSETFLPGTPFQQLPAPLQAVRGVSGAWLGAGTLSGTKPVRAFSAAVEARGPLFAQVAVRYEFDDRGFYQVRVRVISGEDVALVEEEFALSAAARKAAVLVTPPDLAPEPGQASMLSDWLVRRGMGWNAVVTDVAAYPCFRFNFCAGWQPATVTKFDLAGGKELTRTALAAAATDWAQGLVLTPYQARGHRAVAVGFEAGPGGKDYLGIFRRYLSRWRHANENQVPLPWLDDGVTAHCFAYEGRREWGLFVAEAGPQHREKIGTHGQGKPAPIRTALVRHGETPLDKVKDWVLNWDAMPGADAHPRLFCPPGSAERLRQELAALPEPVRKAALADGDLAALVASDAAVRSKALSEALAGLQESITAFLTGGHDMPDSYTHRFQEIVRGHVPAVDIGLADRTVSPAERARALARLTFLAYKISDPDYWPYRGYGGGPSNPNMMSIATNALAMCASACAGHPRQAQWLELCRRLVCADILMSTTEDGVWLECPGYQGAGNTPLNMTVLILANAGVADLTRDPLYGQRLLAVSRYCANLLTPPDPRFQGRRMPMALGDNVPFFNNMYVYLAGRGRESWPAAAGEAAWCWEQMGRPVGSAGLILLQEGVLAGKVTPVPIAGKSVAWKGFGAMLRHGFATPAETYLTFLQNGFAYGHYDVDMGSFSWFAKGAPLCLDWIDYSPGAAADHNRVDYGPANRPWFVPDPLFVSHAEADYLSSWEASAPPGAPPLVAPDAKPEWRRHLLLVKDTADPGDATYLVLRDQVTTERPSTWNCWTLAEKGSERIEGAVARLKGQHGVDLAMFFFRPLTGPLRSTFYHHQTRSYITMDQDMTRIQARAETGGDYGVVLYPLRRGVDVEPAVTELPGGVVELSWPSGRRHLLFLFPEARDATAGTVHFSGQAGIAKFAAGTWTLVPLAGQFGR